LETAEQTRRQQRPGRRTTPSGRPRQFLHLFAAMSEVTRCVAESLVHSIDASSLLASSCMNKATALLKSVPCPLDSRNFPRLLAAKPHILQFVYRHAAN
jgi:hypothetical protein